MAEEGLTKTDNDLIHIGKPIPFDTDEFLQQMEKLAVVAYGNDPDIRSYVEEIVPTYHAAKDDLKLHSRVVRRRKYPEQKPSGRTVRPNGKKALGLHETGERNGK